MTEEEQKETIVKGLHRALDLAMQGEIREIYICCSVGEAAFQFAANAGARTTSQGALMAVMIRCYADHLANAVVAASDIGEAPGSDPNTKGQ